MFSKAYDCSKFTLESIVSAGEKALVCLYKEKLTDSLDSLRYTMFCQKVTSSKLYIKPEVVSPTSAVARYHFIWVLYQVRQWMSESIKAHEWSWAITDTQMQQKYTDLGYAPDELLSQICCKCKTNCLTLHCT